MEQHDSLEKIESTIMELDQLTRELKRKYEEVEIYSVHEDIDAISSEK